MTKPHPIIPGTKFNRLTLLEEAPSIIEKNHSARRRVKCSCDCGRIIIVDYCHVKDGHTKSCGCYAKEKRTIHGFNGTRLSSIYRHILRRCYSPSDENYKWYGAKGIKMCDEWLNNRKLFFDWAMSNGYKDNLTIDRINNNGNYEPSNCRWVTTKVNNRNRPTTRLSFEDAQDIRNAYLLGCFTQKEIAEGYGVCSQYVGQIINNQKWV